MDPIDKAKLETLFTISEDGTTLLHSQNRGQHVKKGKPAAKDVDGVLVVKASGHNYTQESLLAVLNGTAETAEPIPPSPPANDSPPPAKKSSRVNSVNLGKKRKVESHVAKVGKKYEARLNHKGSYVNLGSFASKSAATEALAEGELKFNGRKPE